MNALEWAVAFYNEHVACTAGHDAGPIVDDFLIYAGARPGEAWCASFVSYCAHKALTDLAQTNPQVSTEPPFRSASSQFIKRWAESEGRLFSDPNHLVSCKGALGGWTDSGDASFGHVFFVARRLTNESGEVVGIGTVEGNSDSTPNNAVNEMRRDVPSDDGHEIWFVDLTGVPGCEWW